MTGDNGANMKDAANELKFPYISCLAHVINRVIVTTLTKLEISLPTGDGNVLITKCRKLVTGFNHSNLLNENLVSDQVQQIHQKNDKTKIYPLRLIQDVITRWNSLYLMLSRILKLKDSIRRVSNLKVFLKYLRTFFEHYPLININNCIF